MSAHRCNRSGQISVCSVATVLFELDVSIGHSVQSLTLSFQGMVYERHFVCGWFECFEVRKNLY
jgi:hypothetical protein